jgi:hypothetical protein
MEDDKGRGSRSLLDLPGGRPLNASVPTQPVRTATAHHHEDLIIVTKQEDHHDHHDASSSSSSCMMHHDHHHDDDDHLGPQICRS